MIHLPPLRLTMATIGVVAGTAMALPRALQGQDIREAVPDSGFAPLRADGNGVAALRANVPDAFEQITVEEALRRVAARLRLDLTFDPYLPGLAARLRIPAANRTAAVVLLEIAHAGALRIDVSPTGQLVARDAKAPPPVAAVPSDSAEFARRVAKLPPVLSEAKRQEQIAFQSRPNVSTVTVTGSELRSAPRFLAEADVLRSVQLLPGVEARNDYYAGINVRGGEADQNLVLLDGFPIYNPFHLGGLFGTFIDPAVGRIELLSGGFPARYDGRLSSVLDVQSTEESRRGIHGTGELSLIASTGWLGGALPDGNGSWMIAARRTYVDKFVDMLPTQDSLPYHFRDAQAHLTRELPGGVRLSLTGYDGLDQISAADKGALNRVYWGNQVIGGTLARTFSLSAGRLAALLGDSLTLDQRVSHSRFALDVSLEDTAFWLKSSATDARAAGSITSYRPGHATQLGYELSNERLAFASHPTAPFVPVDSSGQRTRAFGAFLDERWSPSRALMIDAGARLETVSAARWSALLPRLSVKYFLNPDLALVAAGGEYAQWMRSLAREDIPLRPLDFWVGSDSAAPVSRAWDLIGGVESWLSRDRALRVEAFYKRYGQLMEPNPFDDALVRGDEFLPVRGSSYGLDLMLRQFDTGRFGGWLSYTYERSIRVDASGHSFAPAQDRRHDLTLVGNWRFTKYTIGTSLNVATGTPYTNVLGTFTRRTYDPAAHDYPGGDQNEFLIGPRNAGRLPTTERLDLSITRNGHIRGVAVSPYLSIMNLLDTRNIFAYAFDYSKRPPERVGLPQPPILPTIGVSIAW